MYKKKISGLLILMLAQLTMLSTQKSDLASEPTEYSSIYKEQFSSVCSFKEHTDGQRHLQADMPVGVYIKA